MAAEESVTPCPDLPALLKFLRRRIDRDARKLGPHARRPSRVGRFVTQEEVAEAIGVSREWYTLLECGAARTRASTGLLDRLADALMVTPAERAMLFHLAVPELGPVQLRDDSIAVLEGFSRLRALTKRLWTAGSTEDVLTSASEQIADWFEGARLVRSTRRRDSGLWEQQSADDKQDRSKAAKVIQEMGNLAPTSAALDALCLYPRLADAGDVGTPDLWPLGIRQEAIKVYARRNVAGFAGLYGRVRSRSGFIGGLYMFHDFGHSYSAADVAVFAAFAEHASLALS